MILADQTPVFPIIIGIAALVGLVIGALALYRGYEYLARRSLERRYADLQIHSDPQPGDVILTYHTYHGFIAWFTQTPHHVALPPADARILLGRLLRFNFMWGFITYGAAFVPPLSIYNYIVQRRSITRQQAIGGYDASETTSTDVHVVETPAMGNRLVGWIAAGLCVVFAISAVMSILEREFEIAIGSALIAALLGWVARDWIGKRHTKVA